MAGSEHGCELRAATTVHTQGVDPYASTMAQLSIAPATTTTVVTTTTTTTTQFPPMVFKPPRNLGQRDPKEYPLAYARTPDNLRRFSFEVAGARGYFEEAAEGVDAVAEVCYMNNELNPAPTR
jgi:F-box and WD-40 domain protein CDC4